MLALVLAAPLPAAMLPGHLLPAAHAQQKRPLTLEAIWAEATFQPATAPGGQHASERHSAILVRQ